MSKRIIKILIAGCLLVVLFWAGFLAKCEILTWQHGDEFAGLWKQEPALREPEYCKVLEYTEQSASVYYVSPGQGGTVLNFSRQDEDWILENWGPYWSKTGSADDLIWPYIR